MGPNVENMADFENSALNDMLHCCVPTNASKWESPRSIGPVGGVNNDSAMTGKCPYLEDSSILSIRQTGNQDCGLHGTSLVSN
jgi:hypothetical protein